MSFKSHIYDKQEIVENTTNWPLFILFLLILLLGYLLIDLNGTLGSIIMILSMIGMTFDLYRNWGKTEEQGKYIGEIILTGDLFTLNNEIVKTSDIDDLKIVIGYPKGYKHWHRHGYTVESGTSSSLEFSMKGLVRHYNFQIISDEDIKDLRKVLEELYIKGIFVKEFYQGERTYLLEELDYEDIQEFKKKYRLG